MKTPLPATFGEVDLEASAEPVEHKENESISKYFTKSAISQLETNVKQSADYDRLKEDAMLHDFVPASAAVYVPWNEVRESRNRPDTKTRARSASREDTENAIAPADAAEQSETTVQKVKDSAMATELAKNGQREYRDQDEDDEDDAAMDTESDSETEQEATQVVTDVPKKAAQEAAADKASGESLQTETSATSATPAPPKEQRSRERVSRIQKPGDRYPPQHQKRPYESTTPSTHRPQYPQQRFRRSSSGYSQNYRDQRQAMPYGPYNVPPPPGQSETYNPWRSDDDPADGHRSSDSPQSATSQHTLPGGEFETRPNQQNRRPHGQTRPESKGGSGRKRSHDEMDRQSDSERRRQVDDVTPRLQRHRPKVPDAYRSVMR